MERSARYLGRDVVFVGRYRRATARIRYPGSSVVHIVPLDRVVVLRNAAPRARDAA